MQLNKEMARWGKTVTGMMKEGAVAAILVTKTVQAVVNVSVGETKSGRWTMTMPSAWHTP